MLRLIVIGASLALSGSTAQAADPVALDPKGPWTLDYAHESCALSRTFGTATETFRLEMRQYQPDGLMDVVVSGPFKTRKGDFEYAFTPDIKLREMGPPERGTTPQGEGVIRFSSASLRTVAETAAYFSAMYKADGEAGKKRVPRWSQFDRDARTSKIVGLKIQNAFTPNVLLKTGAMTAPLAAMDKCFDQLISEWNLDPNVQRNLKQRVALQDYQTDRKWWDPLDQVMRKAKSSHTRLWLLVKAHGRVETCRVLGPARDTEEAAKFCAAFNEIARFEPALAEDGTPTDSYFLEEITVGVAAL